MHCRLGEINIICTDLERSLRFYCDVLGFRALDQEGPAWHLACGDARFLLLAVAEEARPISPYCLQPEFSLDLLVENLNDARQICEEAGVPLVSEFPPTEERFFIRDPDGLVLEIIRSN